MKLIIYGEVSIMTKKHIRRNILSLILSAVICLSITGCDLSNNSTSDSRSSSSSFDSSYSSDSSLPASSSNVETSSKTDSSSNHSETISSSKTTYAVYIMIYIE